MVKISIYNGFIIKYEDKKFYATSAKLKKETDKCDSEDICKAKISLILEEIEKAKITENSNFTVTFAEPKYFIDGLKKVTEFCNEFDILFSNKGISVIKMDPANVMMIILEIDVNVTSHYEIKNDVRIGINGNKLFQILNNVGPSDILRISRIEKEKILIEIISHDTLSFSIPIFEPDSRKYEEPELNFKKNFESDILKLSRYINSADIFADSLKIELFDDIVWFIAEGNEEKFCVDFSPKIMMNNDCDSKTKLKSKFSIEYLKKIVNFPKKSCFKGNYLVQMSNDYPIIFSTEIPEKVKLKCILAPRVED